MLSPTARHRLRQFYDARNVAIHLRRRNPQSPESTAMRDENEKDDANLRTVARRVRDVRTQCELPFERMFQAVRDPDPPLLPDH